MQPLPRVAVHVAPWRLAPPERCHRVCRPRRVLARAAVRLRSTHSILWLLELVRHPRRQAAAPAPPSSCLPAGVRRTRSLSSGRTGSTTAPAKRLGRGLTLHMLPLKPRRLQRPRPGPVRRCHLVRVGSSGSPSRVKRRTGPMRRRGRRLGFALKPKQRQRRRHLWRSPPPPLARAQERRASPLLYLASRRWASRCPRPLPSSASPYSGSLYSLVSPRRPPLGPSQCPRLASCRRRPLSFPDPPLKRRQLRKAAKLPQRPTLLRKRPTQTGQPWTQRLRLPPLTSRPGGPPSFPSRARPGTGGTTNAARRPGPSLLWRSPSEKRSSPSTLPPMRPLQCRQRRISPSAQADRRRQPNLCQWQRRLLR